MSAKRKLRKYSETTRKLKESNYAEIIKNLEKQNNILKFLAP